MDMRKTAIGFHILRTIAAIKRGKRVPLYCEWEITSRCNMRCSFCSTWVADRNSQPETTTEDALRIVDELQVLGTRIVHFSGGEPTLRKDFSRIIEAAQEKRMLVAFTTNGSASVEDMGKLLCADIIRVSIDGVGDLHDNLRRSPGAYVKAIKTVEFLLSNGKKPLITTVYSNQTKRSDLDKLLSVAKDLGVQMAILPASKNINQAVEKSVGCELSPAFDDYEILMKDLCKKYGKTVSDPSLYLKVIKEGGLDLYGCHAMDMTMSIKAGGSVSMPCNGLQLKLCKGNMSGIFFGKDALDMRELQGTHHGCKECAIRCMISASGLLKANTLLTVINSYFRGIM